MKNKIWFLNVENKKGKIIQKEVKVSAWNYDDVDMMICDRDERIAFFENCVWVLPKDQIFDKFLDVYKRSESGFDALRADLEVVKKYRKPVDFSKIKRHIDKKNTMTIYRGVASKSAPLEKACSWTLSKRTAKFFANRGGVGLGQIYTAKINIRFVYAYIGDLGESEILLNPKHLRDIRRIA